MLARGRVELPQEQHARAGASLLHVGASHPVLAAAGQWVVALTMQLPWLSLLLDSWEAQPQGGPSQETRQASKNMLTEVGFSQVVLQQQD